jgi:hypothetical protein
MGKWSAKEIAYLVVFCAVGIAWFTLPEPEPIYKREPLSYWLHAYDDGNSASLETLARHRQADDAIKATGAKAIPTLLRLLDSIGTTGNRTKNSMRVVAGVEVESGFTPWAAVARARFPNCLKFAGITPIPWSRCMLSRRCSK